MKGFDVLNVKSAVKSRNVIDLSFDHLTTMKFGEIVPLVAKELVPSDEFPINANYFSRMAPLVKPTYGKFSFRTVSAFVPYHQIANDSDAWLDGKISFEGNSTHHRYFTIHNLEYFIASRCCTSSGATADNCDFAFIDSSGQQLYYKFHSLGKYYVKVLCALGYAVPQGVDTRTSSAWWTTIRLKHLSAYPLLAFFKLYNDYMSQSQRFNTSVLSKFLHDVKHGVSNDYWTSSTGEISEAGINLMFNNLRLNYDNDYFTSAWQNPNSPLASIDSIIETPVPSSLPYGPTKVVNNLVDNYTEVQGNSGLLFKINQRALDFLRSFDDWVRRNNYSGSRSVQQIYSRFGIKTDDYRSNYAHVIKTESMPIQVGDVTSTADTSDGQLGEYAGKAIMNGNDSVYYKADDHGMLFILGYFTVKPMMAYGFDRQVLRSEPLDYYNPEFDGIGADAISYAEVYENPIAGSDDTSRDDSVFGYTERYNNYRYGRDVITGDFRNYHVDSEMNTWHTGRNLSELRKNGEMFAQSSSMNTLEQSDSQYRRIFSITDGPEDYFYLTCHFEIKAIRPMLNLNQVVNLGVGDTNVPRNGNVIS